MAVPKGTNHTTMTPAICIELKPVDEHAAMVPKRRRAPQFLPIQAPLPRQGEIVYLSSTSAWSVRGVLHEWLTPQYLHVTVLIEYQGHTHHAARPDFALTQ
jgi:hypothetical protein